MEIVPSYNYLGVTLDDKLNFEVHVNNQVRKANKRLYFVRNMNKLKVQTNIIHLFYNTIISSMINYCSVSFYNNLSKQLQKQLDRPRAVCKRIAKNCELKNYKDIYEEKLMVWTKKVLNDHTHPLYSEFVFIPSTRLYNAQYTQSSNGCNIKNFEHKFHVAQYVIHNQ